MFLQTKGTTVRSRIPTFAIIGLGLLTALALPAGALATAGTASITGGSLSMTAPTTVAFSSTLNGTDQTAISPQAFDVLDQTGSAAGWNLTATSTTFTSGANTLSTAATTLPLAPSPSCDASVTCTTAVTNVSYPYTLPAGPTAPTATKMYNATASTGLGNQTAAASLNLAIPGTTKAGAYTSTWTYSLVSGP